jgi:hypothetical protein
VCTTWLLYVATVVFKSGAERMSATIEVKEETANQLRSLAQE